MDDLNAQQIVLLTLLVSFVTSIATGIVTVSLLEQAPEPVTQTINRVVEKTVERVITEPSDNTETIIEREVVTVVVNEEDLTIEAVEKNSRSIVRLYSGEGENQVFVKLGLVAGNDGSIITDEAGLVEEVNYVAKYQSGEYPVSIVKKPEGSKLVLLQIKESEEVTNPRDFRSGVLANSDSIQLGQSVISLSGQITNRVSTGIINSLEKNEEGQIYLINSSVSEQNVLPGSVLINLKGEIIGLRIAAIESTTSFMPVNMVKKILSEEPAEEQVEEQN